MSQVYATPTKHDLESPDADEPDIFYPLTRCPKRSPQKSITKKKSIVASAFGSLRSHFRGNERSDAASPTPDQLSTPRRLAKLKSFATLRGTRSANKQDDNGTSHIPSGAAEQDYNRLAVKARRRKSLGDLIGSVSGKRSQKRIDLHSVTATCTEDNESKTTEPDGPAFLPILPPARLRRRNSDVFSIRDGRDGREPLLPNNLKTSQSFADFRLPDPAQRIDSPRVTSQGSNNGFTKNIHYDKDGSRRDSFWFEVDALANPDCRGAQQENQIPLNHGTRYCTPRDFQENASQVSSVHSQLASEISGCADANADAKGVDWLFEQINKEDGLWPSSDTYLRQIVSTTGDGEDRKLYDGDEEPFKGPSPDMYLRRTSNDLANFQLLCNRANGLGDPFQANQYLELTSPTEASRAIRASSASRTFKLLEDLKTETICNPARVTSPVRSHILSSHSMGKEGSQERLERKVKTLDFDTFFSREDLRTERHDALFSEKPRQNKFTAKEIERRIALTAATMSKNYCLSSSGSESDMTDGSIEQGWNTSSPDASLHKVDEKVLGASKDIFQADSITASSAQRHFASNKCHLSRMIMDFIGYQDEAHRTESLPAMERDREEDAEEERHLAVQRLARKEWVPWVKDIDSFIRYGLGTFESIASFPNYIPQNHVPGWTEAVLENSIDLRSIAQQSFDQLGMPTVTGTTPSKKYFFFKFGAAVEHIENLDIEDDIYGVSPPRRIPPHGWASFKRDDNAEAEDDTCEVSLQNVALPREFHSSVTSKLPYQTYFSYGAEDDICEGSVQNVALPREFHSSVTGRFPYQTYFSFGHEPWSLDHHEQTETEDEIYGMSPKQRIAPTGSQGSVGSNTVQLPSVRKTPVVSQLVSHNDIIDKFEKLKYIPLSERREHPCPSNIIDAIEVQKVRIITSKSDNEIETAIAQEVFVPLECANTQPANIANLSTPSRTSVPTPADSVWSSEESSLRSETELENDRQGLKASVTVSFPGTISHQAYSKSYESRNDAILNIQKLRGQEYSEFCIYDPQTNAIQLLLDNDASPLDIIADLENQGHELLWLPSSLSQVNESQRKHGQEQEFDKGFEDFVFNDQNSEETNTEHDSTSHLLGVVENRSLSNIEPFPDYQEDFPAETFGGSPIGMIEPFPKFEEHLSVEGLRGLPTETSQVNNEYNQSIIRVREVNSSDSDSCYSHEVAVDPSLARRWLGSDFCDNYLDGNMSAENVFSSSSATLCSRSDIELQAALGDASSKKTLANTANSVINDSFATLRSKAMTEAALAGFGSRIMTQRIFSSDVKQKAAIELPGDPSVVTGKTSEDIIDNLKAEGQSTHGIGTGRGNISPDNSKTRAHSISKLSSNSSEISLPSGSNFSQYGASIRQTTLDKVIPDLVKERLMRRKEENPSAGRPSLRKLPRSPLYKPRSIGKGKGKSSEESNSSSILGEGATSSENGKGKSPSGIRTPGTFRYSPKPRGKLSQWAGDEKARMPSQASPTTRASQSFPLSSYEGFTRVDIPVPDIVSPTSSTYDTDDSSLYRR